MTSGNHPEGPGRGKASVRLMEPKEGKTMGTSKQDMVSTKLHRIAEMARKTPQMVGNKASEALLDQRMRDGVVRSVLGNC